MILLFFNYHSNSLHCLFIYCMSMGLYKWVNRVSPTLIQRRNTVPSKNVGCKIKQWIWHKSSECYGLLDVMLNNWTFMCTLHSTPVDLSFSGHSKLLSMPNICKLPDWFSPSPPTLVFQLHLITSLFVQTHILSFNTATYAPGDFFTTNPINLADTYIFNL